MKLVNLNKHKISVLEHNGSRLEFPPSGTVATVAVSQEIVGNLDGIPVKKNVYGAVQGLPAPEEGVVYIANAMVLAALQGSRSDVVAPDTGPSAIRFADGPQKGQVDAVTAFVQ